jgi:hypothetical protein
MVVRLSALHTDRCFTPQKHYFYASGTSIDYLESYEISGSDGGDYGRMLDFMSCSMVDDDYCFRGM